MKSSFLALGEAKTRESTHLDGKPLSQWKPSASRRDATSEEKEKLRPETLCESYYQNYLSNSLSGIRLLPVPVTIGTKIAPACKKKLQFLGCSCTAPISARPKLTTLLSNELVDLVVVYCIFGR